MLLGCSIKKSDRELEKKIPRTFLNGTAIVQKDITKIFGLISGTIGMNGLKNSFIFWQIVARIWRSHLDGPKSVTPK